MTESDEQFLERMVERFSLYVYGVTLRDSERLFNLARRNLEAERAAFRRGQEVMRDRARQTCYGMELRHDADKYDCGNAIRNLEITDE